MVTPLDSSAGDKPKVGIVLIVSAMFVFATQDAITKILADHYAATQILWIRFAVFAGFALFYTTREKPLHACLRSRVPWLQIGRSLLIVFEIGMFIMAIRYLSLVDIHALLATAPLMATAIAAIMLRERVGLRRWMAVMAGFVGVLVILRPGLGIVQPGAILALVTAFLFASYQVITRVVAKYDDAATSTVYMAFVGFAVLSVIAPFQWRPIPSEDWFLLIALSITATLGHMLLIKALEAAPASTLQPFNYTMLVFAAIIGYLIFDTLPDVWTVIGAGIVVGGGLYTLLRERSHATKQSE